MSAEVDLQRRPREKLMEGYYLYIFDGPEFLVSKIFTWEDEVGLEPKRARTS